MLPILVHVLGGGRSPLCCWLFEEVYMQLNTGCSPFWSRQRCNPVSLACHSFDCRRFFLSVFTGFVRRDPLRPPHFLFPPYRRRYRVHCCLIFDGCRLPHARGRRKLRRRRR
ncbi:unnamed protein product [Laminaria digitata]